MASLLTLINRIRRIHFLIKIPTFLALTLFFQSLSRGGDDFPATFLLNLACCTAATFALQAAVGLVSVLLRTELFYDLSGAGGFFLVAGLSLSLGRAAGGGNLDGSGEYAGVGGVLRGVGRAVGTLWWDGGVWREMGVDWRQGWVSAVVCVWAGRFGIYTFLRSLYRGGDSRFDNIRTDRTRFFTVFMLQGVWVTLCTVPVVALNSIPPEGFAGARWWTEDRHTWLSGPWRMVIFWLGLWSFFRGFVIECLADWQLMKWRWDKDRKKHDEVFCGTGLWEKSRHPNYFGECLIWLGISICCFAALVAGAAQKTTGMGWFTAFVVCWTAPYFVYKMVSNISIPLIEKKHDKQYMARKEYEIWRRHRSFRLWLDGSGIVWGYA